MLLDQLAGRQIVEAMSDFDHSVGNGLVVGPTIGGVDSVSFDCLAERGKGRVLVMEKFHEDMLELTRWGIGGEQCSDPAVIGGEASSGGLGGGVEGSPRNS